MGLVNFKEITKVLLLGWCFVICHRYSNHTDLQCLNPQY